MRRCPWERLLPDKRGRRFPPPPSHYNSLEHPCWRGMPRPLQSVHSSSTSIAGREASVVLGSSTEASSSNNRRQQTKVKGGWHFFKKGDCFSARFPIKLHAIDLERQRICQNSGGPRWKNKNLLLMSIHQNENRVSFYFSCKQRA